jgi:hypothetical protein
MVDRNDRMLVGSCEIANADHSAAAHLLVDSLAFQVVLDVQAELY